MKDLLTSINCRGVFGLLLILSALSSNAQYFDWEARSGQNQKELQAMAADMNQRGFQPRVISASAWSDGSVSYSTVWQKEPNTFPWECWLTMDEADYLSRLRTGAANGWSPTDVSTYVVDGQVMYAAISTRDYNPSPSIVFTRVAASRFKATIDSCASLGYTLVDINGYEHEGGMYYAAIFRAFSSGRWVYTFGDNEQDFQTRSTLWTSQGYSPISTNSYEFQGSLRCSAVWSRANNEAWESRQGFTQEGYQNFFDKMVDQNYALVHTQEYISNGRVLHSGIFRRAPPVPRVSGAQIIAGQLTNSATPQTLQLAASGRRVLPIIAVQQQTPVWCWLAVGEMIMSHLGVPNLNPTNNYQCGILGTIAYNSPCASNCFAPGCIVPSGSNHNTVRMLREYSWIAGNQLFEGNEARELPFVIIRANIDNNKPILCGISPTSMRDNGGAEHVVLLIGYELNAGKTSVIINDPFPYSINSNPYLRNGGSQLNGYQYRIPLNNFTNGLFWHWSIFNITLS